MAMVGSEIVDPWSNSQLNSNKIKFREKEMDGEETRTEIIKILEAALIKYATKENWSKSESTGDLDQFGLRGEGFETALEALEKCKELLEEFTSRNSEKSLAAQQKQIMDQIYAQKEQEEIKEKISNDQLSQWMKASTTKLPYPDEKMSPF